MQEHKHKDAPLLGGRAKQPECEKVHVESVDDILLELTAATMESMVDVNLIPQYVDLLRHDKPNEREFGPCAIANCSCQACLHGDCGNCEVEQTRWAYGDDNWRTRDLIKDYRNRGW